jgi:hypothetical protein
MEISVIVVKRVHLHIVVEHYSDQPSHEDNTN